MISVPPGVRVWLAARPVDMRKGFDGLAAVVQQHLGQDPFSGQIFAFRGKRGDLLKLLVWPSPATERVRLSPAELAMLPEGIDWRALRRTDEPRPSLTV